MMTPRPKATTRPPLLLRVADVADRTIRLVLAGPLLVAAVLGRVCRAISDTLFCRRSEFLADCSDQTLLLLLLTAFPLYKLLLLLDLALARLVLGATLTFLLAVADQVSRAVGAVALGTTLLGAVFGLAAFAVVCLT